MIPRTIHHVWVGGPIPPELEAYRQTWSTTHPEWEMRLWGDDDLDWIENRDLFDRAAEIVPERNIGQFRANLARYEILWRHGGVYADMDMESLKPLDRFCDLDAWVAWEHEPGTRKGPLIGNTIMAAAPGSAWMRRCIDQVRPDTATFAGEPSWRMSGPSMLSRLHDADPTDHTVLPERWFYPYPTELPAHGASGNYGDAYCVHHWAHRRNRRHKAFPAPVSAWPPRLSVAIMAHPSRADQVRKIEEALDVPPVVVWDEGRGLWDTARRAWLAHDPDATHHLVLQDDVVVCRDLIAGLTRALEQVPTSPVTAFTMRYRVKPPARAKVAASTDPWFRDTRSLSGQAIVLPVADIAAVVKYGDRSHRKYDDQKILEFYTRRRVDVWHTVPSLVDHLDAADGNHTLLEGNDRPERGRRKAIRFLGETASALDWAPTVGGDDAGHTR